MSDKPMDVSRDEIWWAIGTLLDIAEEFYPNYYSDDRIATCNDILKKIDWEEYPIKEEIES